MSTSSDKNTQKSPGYLLLFRKILTISSILYLLVVVILSLILWSAGDNWWVATLLLFGAHWLWALPLAILVPAAIFLQPRTLLFLLPAALIIIFPVMGFNIPWQHLLKNISAAHSPSHNSSPRLRVLTCNTHQEELNQPALAELITNTQPDIVALQEFQINYRSAVFTDKSWHLLYDGELCIASRYPIKKLKDLVEPDINGGGGHATAYAISIPGGTPLYFINLHLASPHPSFNAILSQSPTAHEQVTHNFTARREQAQIVSDFAATAPGKVILAGDFNTPPNSNIFREYYAPFTDAFSSAGVGFGYTYFYGKRSQVRIDHILGSPSFDCRKSWITPTVGSKHLPLIADLY